MKCGKNSVCLLLLLTATTTAPATEKEWLPGTAYTLSGGRYEIGLFQPLRVGFKENLELSTHPILGFVSPNITFKISFTQFRGWDIATRHSIIYPTPLLRKLRIKGFGIQALADMDVGGIIANDPDISQIPHMMSSKNEVLVSQWVGNSTLVTGKAGIVIAIKTGDLDTRTTIDLPIVFPRLGVYYNGYGFNTGADILNRLTKRINLLFDTDLFFLPGLKEGDFAFEHKGLLYWNKSSRFQVCLGYKLVYGKYPFGTHWHLLPLLDFQWGRERK